LSFAIGILGALPRLRMPATKTFSGPAQGAPPITGLLPFAGFTGSCTQVLSNFDEASSILLPNQRSGASRRGGKTHWRGAIRLRGLGVISRTPSGSARSRYQRRRSSTKPCWTQVAPSPSARERLHRDDQRFESPPLHQEVQISGGGSPGFEISRPYKALAWPSAVCDGHLVGLSASRAWTRRQVSGRKIPFPKSALVGCEQPASET
jgi:hypothetical protein